MNNEDGGNKKNRININLLQPNDALSVHSAQYEHQGTDIILDTNWVLLDSCLSDSFTNNRLMLNNIKNEKMEKKRFCTQMAGKLSSNIIEK